MHKMSVKKNFFFSSSMAILGTKYSTKKRVYNLNIKEERKADIERTLILKKKLRKGILSVCIYIRVYKADERDFRSCEVECKI